MQLQSALSSNPIKINHLRVITCNARNGVTIEYTQVADETTEAHGIHTIDEEPLAHSENQEYLNKVASLRWLCNGAILKQMQKKPCVLDLTEYEDDQLEALYEEASAEYNQDLTERIEEEWVRRDEPESN